VRPALGAEVVVSAAASLTQAMGDIGAAFTRENPGIRVDLNFASSGALQQQIEQGAPVDVFIAAAPQEMDVLQRALHLVPGTRFGLATNRMALIAPVGSRLKTWADLASPRVRRVAIGAPETVPAGMYAKQTLEHRGLWAGIRNKLAYGQNVRQTLAYVENGDVDAGIVFLTDTRIGHNRVQIVALDAPGDHSAIIYPAAAIRGGPSPALARRFLQFLKEPIAQRILAKWGFAPYPGDKARPREGG
jgi:molybdate transport system substrate-binding protein